jgi:hypothetical protein
MDYGLNSLTLVQNMTFHALDLNVLRGMVLYKENDGGRMVWIGFAGWLVLGLVKKKKKKMLDGVFLVLVLFSDRGGGGGF